MSKPVFVSWIDHHGRSEGLARLLGATSISWGGGDGGTIRRYSRLALWTWKALRADQTDLIIVMLPPTPAILACWAVLPRSVRIVGDLHTGAFLDPKWKWSLPLVARLLRKRGGAIVTNQALADEMTSRGVDTFVMHDAVDSPAVDRIDIAEAERYVLAPVAYARDEPLREMLLSAAQAPKVRWKLTGRPPAELLERAPGNVEFTGWLDQKDYMAALSGAAVVVALTTEEFTMQRAAYEALAVGSPLVTARTQVLVDYFGKAAVFADCTAGSISAAVAEALARGPELRREMVRLGRQRRLEQESRGRMLLEWLGLQ